ncbi:MAG: hypothetical protein KAR20_24870, partial [Candidatus Heimdallarchaeota archaeon]|nr:hypothetical protein [Candidatus Heimdallarchaeota archaeon]
MDKYRCTRPLLPVLSLVMIFFHLSNSAFAVPPSQPATIVIEREGIEGQLKEMPDVIVLPVLVEFTRDVQSIELIVLQSRLVKDPFLKEKNTIFKEKLTHGKEAEIAFSIPIEIIEPGHYEIDIRLSGYVDKHNGFSDRKILHILVDKEGIFRFLTGAQYIREKRLLEKNQFDQRFKKNEASPNMCLLSDETIQVPDDIAKKIKPFDIPTDEQMQADPAIPSELTREYVIDKSHERFTSKGTGTITVRGRLAYLDYNGDLRPLVNVSVYCYDEEDLRPDEYLGATRTNWNGEWSFIDINNDDGWLEDGRDIYYTFKLENTRIRVQDCDWIDETYAWRSEQHDNVADGTVLDFG